MKDLPILQKTYDLIQWYIPILERLPKTHKYTLGDRIINQLYTLFEELIKAQFSQQKSAILIPLNTCLTILRYQSRLLLDFNLINIQRYENTIRHIDSIGKDLGGWIHQQKLV